MKRTLLLIAACTLFLGAGDVASAQRRERPPQNTNRENKKRPPGPIMREEKRGDNAQRGERDGGRRDNDRPPRRGRP